MTKVNPRKISDIPKEDGTDLVIRLLEVIQEQKELIQQLRDEIAILKKQKPKPKIKPSKMDKNNDNADKNDKKSNGDGKRPGSKKKSKTVNLVIHEIKKIPVEDVPKGSQFKGYDNFTVQDIIIKQNNILYRLEVWETPDGKRLKAELPKCVDGHFGAILVCYILYQHYHARVTQPLLLEELKEFGVDISSGQLNRILVENKDIYHKEKQEVLRTGIEVSRYLNVDDTGARHDGKNGYCTHIGNELFSYFQSTDKKSRINFLEILRAGYSDYVISDDALKYMQEQRRLPQTPFNLLKAQKDNIFENEQQWKDNLKVLGISKNRHIQIATEGALLGSVLNHGFSRELVIVSDDAGQFNLLLLLHALCWIHAERLINKLIPFNDNQREAIKLIRSKIWKFYDDLKKYKVAPDKKKKTELEARFNDIFTTKTCFATLNQVLKRLYENKAELLLVLDRPELPLHNNLSEGDIREYVMRRKISASTRSILGRKCRDTLLSLKKTSRKLNVSFWKYLYDRESKENKIPDLSELIRLKAATQSTY